MKYTKKLNVSSLIRQIKILYSVLNLGPERS